MPIINGKYIECQLCKHLDCDSEGHFICGLDGVILDHEGIYCDNFEEYFEDEVNNVNIQ